MLIEGSPEQRLVQVKARCAAGSADGYVHLGSIGGDLTFPAVPGVVLGEMPEGASVHQVVVDSYGAGRTAGAYLWDMGHRRVAFLAVKGLIPAAARFQGLAAVLRERAGEHGESATALESYVALEKSDSPALEAELRRLLDLPAPPTAFFFGNDHTAFSALQTLLAWGVRVPGDVSLVSFDDTPGLASQTRPALTALRMPILSLASLTVQTLHQAIQEPDLPFRRLHLPAELILRESSGPPPGR
jgi:LacI family transcriptional regulator